MQPPSDTAARTGESVASGSCSRCGQNLDESAERCPSCGCWTSGNRASFKHGGRSAQVRGALLPEQAERFARLAERRQAIEQDLGGADALSQIGRDLVTRYLETSTIAEFLAGVLVANGPLTPRGRARSALNAFLQVLDRQHRLALALGLERRSKRLPSLHDYLDERAAAQESQP